MKYVMALDAGTTSNRCMIFDHDGMIRSVCQIPLTQHYPKPGWVEHDALEIWASMLRACKEAMKKIDITPKDIAAIGVTNQRETSVVWNKNTGKPVHNAIVWQCRRTSDYCDSLKEKGLVDTYKKKTGLVIDAFFSATKVRWILENVPGARESAEKGDFLFGTIDTWLIWNLSRGKLHITDYSNASRTMLYNITELKWDAEILSEMNIPECMLPEVKDSSCVYGKTDVSIFGSEIPIAGDAGDQQAAMFGQMCLSPGDVKNTYGTGGFLLMNTGKEPVFSDTGLLTTIAWGMNGIVYAIEGSIYVAGAAIQWLRDELGIVETSAETEAMAMSVEDTAGCYIVPAFAGLGAPHWDQYARGAIVGITRGVNKNHLARATLESLAFQVNDVLVAMREDSGTPITTLKIDGGASVNNFLAQTQADFANVRIVRPKCTETTALGAAYLAGLAVGYWKDVDEIEDNWSVDRVFEPMMSEEERERKICNWNNAVGCARVWKHQTK